MFKSFSLAVIFITRQFNFSGFRVPNLPSMCEIEINRKNTNPSCSKPKIVPYLYLLINCLNVSFIHFHRVHYLFLVHVRHFLSHLVIIFGPFWRPFWSSALGNRLMVTPALTAMILTLEFKTTLRRIRGISLLRLNEFRWS